MKPPRLDKTIPINQQRPIGLCIKCDLYFADYYKAVKHMYKTNHYVTPTIYGQEWLRINNKKWFHEL